MNQQASKQFSPPYWLRNPHLQNIISNSSFRRWRLNVRHSNFRQSAQTIELNTPKGVTLRGKLNQQKPSRGLVILFHGWEGSTESSYVLSLSTYLFKHGFDIFRLNFRDHGNTHHLNKGIFNSTLIDEVIEAVKEIQQLNHHDNYFLGGFSLGGNFALRIAHKQQCLAKPLQATFAISPVFDPAITMKAFASSPAFYEKYFVKKWKRSLQKKLYHFPEYNYQDALHTATTLDDLNQFFIPRYTHYDCVESYFKGYTLYTDLFKELTSPTLIISAQDDPIIPVAYLNNVKEHQNLTLDVQQYGSHCAFMESTDLTSWADKRTLDFITARQASTKRA